MVSESCCWVTADTARSVEARRSARFNVGGTEVAVVAIVLSEGVLVCSRDEEELLEEETSAEEEWSCSKGEFWRGRIIIYGCRSSLSGLWKKYDRCV